MSELFGGTPVEVAKAKKELIALQQNLMRKRQEIDRLKKELSNITTIIAGLSRQKEELEETMANVGREVDSLREKKSYYDRKNREYAELYVKMRANKMILEV